MSNGVLASHAAHALVEAPVTHRGRSATLQGPSGPRDEEARPVHGLGHFGEVHGSSWVSGRVTLTAIHLTFTPTPSQAADPSQRRRVQIDLRQIDEVTMSGRLIGGGVVSFVCGQYRMQLRTRSAAQLATQLRAASAQARRRRTR